MKLVDSHCHLNRLDLAPFEGQLTLALDAARQQQVKAFLSVSVELSEHEALVGLADAYDDVYISVGRHPNELSGEPMDLALLERAILHPKVIAIGETGLDYYRCEGDLQWQRDRFVQHIMMAKKHKKPLIIHTREAIEDTLQIMSAHQASEIGGVMHCFTENWDNAKKCLDLGFYISISGIVTFKNAQTVQEVAKKVPLDYLLIETDAPYLAPVPYRGHSNVPGHVYYVAECIARLRNLPMAVIAEKTTQNFSTLFNVLHVG